MFGKLGGAFVEIEARTKNFDAGLGRARGRMDAFASAVSARTSALASGLSSGLGGVASGLAGAFGALAASAGLAALGTGLVKAVQGASDLSETMSKVDATFGDSAGGVKTFADGLARDFGLVKKETLDAAARFAGLGKGIGNLQGAELSGFSEKLTKLAADLSSFQNISMEEAISALSSGLSGEVEPLKRFGAVLSDDSVKAYALAHGMASAGGKMDESQKLAARTALIFEKLGDATGDLERTQGGFANQSRKLWGTLQNTLAAFGAALQPLTDKLVTSLNGMAAGLSRFVEANGPALTAFSEAVGRGFDYVVWVFGQVGEAAAAFGASLANELAGLETFRAGTDALGKAWTWLRDTATEVFATIGIVWRNWSSIVGIATLRAKEYIINTVEAVQWFGEAAGTMLAWFGRNWKAIIVDGFNAAVVAARNFAANAVEAIQALYAFLSDPSQGFHPDWTPLLDGFTATVEKLPDIAAPVFTSLQGEIDGLKEQMGQVETKRQEALAAANKPVPAGAAAAAAKAKPGATVAAPEKPKAEFIGLAEFAKKLQTGLFENKQGQAAERQLGVAQQQLTVQQQQLQEQRRANRTPKLGVAAPG